MRRNAYPIDGAGREVGGSQVVRPRLQERLEGHVPAGVDVYHGRGPGKWRSYAPTGLSGLGGASPMSGDSDEELPILRAASDNGPQTISGNTRKWLVPSLGWHTGRPGVRQDQALIETTVAVSAVGRVA